ncbi:MAG: hypothetical protein WKF37_11065 [Bryobacteraceae bacterium]
MRAALFIFAATLAYPAAEVIDRISVSIGNNNVITESELYRQIRLTALLNEQKPDLSAQAKRATADRLVEQILIRRELDLSRYIGANDKSSVALYEQFKKRFKNEAAYASALNEYEITDEDVREAFAWQSTLLDFIEMRFRPGIQISELDIRDYYENTLLPELPKSEPKPPLEAVHSRIEEILTGQRVDNSLDRWLGNQRTQTRVRYRREVFQ